ncbi:YncE family protein [Corallibacter sp.]|uniref:YncE family protein n=1 Tax=Corallibacter sp. TaxID=2038084 RepID=UPI003AB33823
MKNLLKFLTFSLLLALVTTSCSSDDDLVIPPVSLGDYANGYFVLNEGNGNPATASVTFVSDEGLVEDDVFRIVNPDADEIGTYLQDMFFDDTRAFIISGSANQVTVVDRFTFEYITTVNTDFSAPRYGTVVNDKAYVTNSNDWSTGNDDFVTVIDLNDYTTSIINIGDYSEKILSDNNNVIIANGYFGSGNAATIMNTNNQETTSIDFGVGNSPNSMEEKDDILYVLTYNYASNGKIFVIDLDTNLITSTIDLPSALGETKNLKIENSNIYFTVGASVYLMSLESNVVPTDPILTYSTTSQYGVMYGFDVEDDKIYISDGGDFNSNSNTYEYSLNGDLLNTVTAGVGPNSFHFN